MENTQYIKKGSPEEYQIKQTIYHQRVAYKGADKIRNIYQTGHKKSVENTQKLQKGHL